MREFGPIRKDLQTEDGSGPLPFDYVGYARVVLGQVKAQMAAMGLLQGARTVRLPDGVVIHVASRFGQDAVQIMRPVQPVKPPEAPPVEIPPPVIPQPEIENPQPELPVIELFLLVVFKNTQIAAIPMSAIAADHWPVVYHKQLKDSPGLPDWVMVGQYNFGQGGAVMAPFTLAMPDNHLARDDNYYWLNVLRHGNTGPHAALAVRTTVDRSTDPVMGGQGDTIWLRDGQYSRQAVMTGQTAGDAVVRGIDDQGTYYYAAKINRDTLNASRGGPLNTGDTIAPGGTGSLGGGVPLALQTQMQNVVPPGTSIYVPAAVWSVTAAGMAPATVSYSRVDGLDRQIENSGPRAYSKSLPLVVFRQDGVADHFAVQGVSASGTFQIDGAGGTADDPAHGKYSGSQTINGWSWNWSWKFQSTFVVDDTSTDWTLTNSGIQDVTYHSFPPALGANDAFIDLTAAEGNGTTITPYFSESGYGSYGWMHLSNGKHMLQAFWTITDAPDDTPHLYVDRKDKRAVLEAALTKALEGTSKIAVSLTDVQAMVMDVPLPLIKRIK